VTVLKPQVAANLPQNCNLLKEYHMNEIIDSIHNGQRKQALQQLQESKYLLGDLFEALLELGKPEEIIRMYRVAISTQYLIIKE
jgi:hypothetical protein